MWTNNWLTKFYYSRSFIIILALAETVKMILINTVLIGSCNRRLRRGWLLNTTMTT